MHRRHGLQSGTVTVVRLVETPGFLGGLLSGWNALVAGTRLLMTVVGTLLPFVAVITLIGLPVLIWRRRTTRRDGAAPAPASEASRESTNTYE